MLRHRRALFTLRTVIRPQSPVFPLRAPRLINGLSEHILSRTFSLPVRLVQSGRCDVCRSALKTLSDSFFLCLDEDFCPMTQSSALSNYDLLGMSRPAPASCCSLPRSVFPPVPLFLTTGSVQQHATGSRSHLYAYVCWYFSSLLSHVQRGKQPSVVLFLRALPTLFMRSCFSFWRNSGRKGGESESVRGFWRLVPQSTFRCVMNHQQGAVATPSVCPTSACVPSSDGPTYKLCCCAS